MDCFLAKGKAAFIWLLLLAAFAGCHSIGPGTIPRDRFDYSAAISDSWKNQMLLNMIKLRYADTPMFLEVSSVISQYLIESTMRADFIWLFPPSSNSQALGGTGTFAERPTITYTPIIGEEFTRSIMTPIPPASIFALIEAGWPVDLVFRLAIQSINGISNRRGAGANRTSGDPEFFQIIEHLKVILASDAIGMRVHHSKNMNSTIIFFRRNAPESVLDDIAWLRKELKLKEDAQSFTLIFGFLPSQADEIAVISRSMLEILGELASYIEVPAEHVAEGRAYKSIEESVEHARKWEPLIRIHYSKDKPTDAFVAVPYHDYYFWIDDRDLRSKGMFSFLMLLFTLTEKSEIGKAPIVTIPTN